MPRKSSTNVKKDLENLDTAEKKSTSRAKRTASKASAAKKDGAEKVVKKATNSKKSTAKKSKKLDSINSANLENAEVKSSDSKSKSATTKNTGSKVKSSSTRTTKTTAKSTNKKTSKTSATKKNTTKASGTKSLASKSKQSTSKSKKSATSKTKKVDEKVLLSDDITSSTDLTKKIEVIEYYDLPYRYNQTVVKVLAQTPNTLFIYWDISDEDRENFVKEYGEDFFNNTKPVLVVHNDTMHYSFEIDIDDFANSWYLHVNDANCKYSIELGRRAKYYNEERPIDIPNNYLYVTSSNEIDAPNDHVLFDKNLKTVYFKDVKTNIISAKDITSLSFLRNMGKIYNIYDLHSDFHKDNWLNSEHWQMDLQNPSSSSSPTFR